MANHRSLEAWVEARALSVSALRAARDSWKPYASGLFSQLQRAALSIQLNIAEGYAVGSRGRFVNHLRIAYGSAVETEDLIELAASEGLMGAREAAVSLEKCRRCQRLISGLIKRYRTPP